MLVAPSCLHVLSNRDLCAFSFKRHSRKCSIFRKPISSRPNKDTVEKVEGHSGNSYGQGRLTSVEAPGRQWWSRRWGGVSVERAVSKAPYFLPQLIPFSRFLGSLASQLSAALWHAVFHPPLRRFLSPKVPVSCPIFL